MQKKLKIAVMMELHWPFNRHYKINAGIYSFAATQPNWEVEQCDFPESYINDGVIYDGIIGRISQSCYDVASTKSIPMVNVWMTSPAIEKVANVFTDIYENGYLCAEHLYHRGFKRIVHFGAYPSISTAELNFKGISDFCQQYGLTCSHHLIDVEHKYTLPNWQKFLTEITEIQSQWTPPIGIITQQDASARSLATTLRNLGWQIPQQIAIIGSGNDEVITNSTQPTLSTVALGYFQVGYEAAKCLNDLLNGAPLNTTPILIPAEKLIIQESTDFYAVDNPVLSNVLKFLSNNSDKSLSVDYVAKVVGMGRRTLERMFKSELNRTINDEIIRLRIERMKRLLVETDAPVKSLCSEVGFGTEVHLHNVFKKLTGMTPIMFRKTHKQKFLNRNQ